MDPMNHVYAGWLCTIAEKSRTEIHSNHRERVGDMVEAALGLCRLVDEYHHDLGFLLNEPRGMQVRIEMSIRYCLEQNYQSRFGFGKGKLKRARNHDGQENIQKRCYASKRLEPSSIVFDDVLGDNQTLKIFAEPEVEDALMEQEPAGSSSGPKRPFGDEGQSLQSK
jgi:hypothetical protein